MKGNSVEISCQTAEGLWDHEDDFGKYEADLCVLKLILVHHFSDVFLTDISLIIVHFEPISQQKYPHG